MHMFIDVVRNSILITGLVTVMMMMIESVNIESKGLIFKGLRKTKVGQVVISALLGSIPGCMGGFATVSLYTHGLFSFGALVAMMIATSGDEAFMMLAMIPDKALIIFTLTFVIAVVAGILTDFVKDHIHRKSCSKVDHSECNNIKECGEGYIIHEEHEDDFPTHKHSNKRHFGFKRMTMFVGLALFIAALATGRLAHDHDGHLHNDHHEGTELCESHNHTHHHEGTELCESHNHIESHTHTEIHKMPASTMKINLLSEDWMNVMFAGLSVIVLFVLLFASDHFIEEHLWHHIVKKHLPIIFAWTFGVLLIINIGLQYIDINNWISDNTALMIILAALVGIIPESGPHLVFVTLYAAGIVPMPVLLANCISQDGHASIPLLAESKKSFAYAKLLNIAVAIAAGFSYWLFV